MSLFFPKINGASRLTAMMMMMMLTLGVASLGASPTLASPTPQKRSNLSGTCMTHWLRHATGNSSTQQSHDLVLYEKLMSSIRPGIDENTIHATDPDVVRVFLGGSNSSADYMMKCLGSSNPDCVSAAPCLNSGKCLYQHHPETGLPPSYRCVCQSGFTGKRCQDVVKHCSPNPCQHGGTCVNTHSGYRCLCPTLHSGRNCRKRWLTEQTISNLSSQLVKLGTQLGSMRDNAANSAQRTSDKVDAFLNQLEVRLTSSMEKKLADMTSQYETFQQNMTSSLQRMESSADVRDRSMTSSLHKFQARQQSMTSSLQQMGQKVQNSLSALQSLKSDTSRHINDLTSKSANAQNTLSTLQSFKSDTTRKINALESKTQSVNSESTSKIRALESKIQSFKSDATRKISALESKTQYLGSGCNLKTVGYKYAVTGHRDHDSRDSGEIARITFKKKLSQTILGLSYASTIRELEADVGTYWYFKIDGEECSRPDRVNIYVHQSVRNDHHQPSVLMGVCQATSAGNIGQGQHTITVHVHSFGGDAHSQYGSTSTLEVQEMCPPF